MTFLPAQFDAAFLPEMRSRRLERNWTQSDLARRTNGSISASTLAGSESGHRRIRLEAAWVLAAALELKLSTLVIHAENTMARSERTLLDVGCLLQTRDPLLEPVRRWLRIAHPDSAGPDATVALTSGALAALSDLMGITPLECRRTLAPYPESGSSSARPAASSSQLAGSSAIG